MAKRHGVVWLGGVGNGMTVTGVWGVEWTGLYRVGRAWLRGLSGSRMGVVKWHDMLDGHGIWGD